MNSFSDRLREAMQENGIKQVELAEKLGSVQSYISHILNGKKMPSGRMIRHMAEVLHVNFEWLAEGTGPKKPDLSREEAIAEIAAKILQNKPGSFVERVVAALVKADESQIEALENFLEALKKKED